MTADELRALLAYDPSTGVFRWKVRAARNVFAGDPALRRDSRGYLVITINRRAYKAHRLAWLYVHGVWPVGQLDHRSRVPDDNRVVNLRECTAAQNGQNRSRSRNNTSGHTGVSRLSGGWRAQIHHAGKKVYLGIFDSPERAAAAYAHAKAELHTFEGTAR